MALKWLLGRCSISLLNHKHTVSSFTEFDLRERFGLIALARCIYWAFESSDLSSVLNVHCYSMFVDRIALLAIIIWN